MTKHTSKQEVVGFSDGEAVTETEAEDIVRTICENIKRLNESYKPMKSKYMKGMHQGRNIGAGKNKIIVGVGASEITSGKRKLFLYRNGDTGYIIGGDGIVIVTIFDWDVALRIHKKFAE